MSHKNIVSLLEFVKMDSFYVVCHFKCRVTNKSVISAVEFEPYDGKIEISFKDMLLHPVFFLRLTHLDEVENCVLLYQLLCDSNYFHRLMQ